MSILHVIPLVLLIAIFLIFYFVMHFFIFKRAGKEDKKRISTLFKKEETGVTEEELILEMAESYVKSGKKEKAIEYYDLYLFKKRSADPEVLFKIGKLYEEDSPDKSAEYWQKAAEMGHKPAEECLESIKDPE